MISLFLSEPLRADVAGLEITVPLVCETGSIKFARSGVFGTCFDFGGRPTEATSVSYFGTAHFEVRTATGTVVFSYSQSFSSTNNPIDINICSYVSYGSVLTSGQMNGKVHALPVGTYYVYHWINYNYLLYVFGVPIPGSGSEGSSVFPSSSIAVTDDDIAHDLNLEAVVIGDNEMDVYPIYACNANVSVDFFMEKVDPLINLNYKVTSSWAEVSDCGDLSPSFSDPIESGLFILFANYPQDQVLRLGNVLSSNVFDESPFGMLSNVGKKYKLKFILSNGLCDPIEVEICVLFTDEPDGVTLSLQTCLDPNFLPDCTGLEVAATTTTPGPMMGYSSAPIFLESSTGYVDEVIVQISDNNDNCLHSSIIEVNPLQFTLNNRINLNMAFLDGINLKSLTSEGITNLVVNVIPLNSCSTCIGYDEVTEQAIEIPCDFSNRLDCTFDDPADIFYEEDGSSNVVFELINWQDVIQSSNFRLNSNIGVRPIDDTFLAADQQLKDDFQLYPNPFHNELNYKGISEDGILTIIDATGKVIKKQNLNKDTKQLISFSSFPPGLYFYTFRNTTQYFTGKLLKE